MKKVTYKIEHLTDLEQAMEAAQKLRAKGFRVQVVYGQKITVYAEL